MPIGTANPIPANASSSPGSAIDTTTPTTSPWVFSSGPPELPGFTAASNWISPDKRPALVFVLRSRPETIPVVVYQFVGQYVSNWGYIFAAVVLGTLPMLIVFLLLQRFVIKGFASQVKG